MRKKESLITTEYYLEPEYDLTANDAEFAVHNIGKFSPRKIDRETYEALLDAGTHEVYEKKSYIKRRGKRK